MRILLPLVSLLALSVGLPAMASAFAAAGPCASPDDEGLRIVALQGGPGGHTGPGGTSSPQSRVQTGTAQPNPTAAPGAAGTGTNPPVSAGPNPGRSGVPSGGSVAGPGSRTATGPGAGATPSGPGTVLPPTAGGPARLRFVPTAVTAGAFGPTLHPQPGPFSRPGACDSAGSVCVGVPGPAPATTPMATPPPPPRPSPPVLVDPNPDGGCGPGLPCF